MAMLSAVKGYEVCLELSSEKIESAWRKFSNDQWGRYTTSEVNPIMAMNIAIIAHYAKDTIVVSFMLSQLYFNWGNVVIDVENRLYYDFDDEDGCSSVPRKID